MFKMAAPMVATCRRFLFHFAHEHLEFRTAEIKSIAGLFGIDLHVPDDYDERNPYLVVGLTSEGDARRIMDRTVTVKSLVEVWSRAYSYDELHTQLATLPEEFATRCGDAERSFRVHVGCFNKQPNLQQRIARIEILMDHLSFNGKLDLSARASDTYHLLEYYGPQGSPAPPQPSQVYFGRWLCDGQREAIDKYHLQKRQFISNTSMDPTLAMIMANMAHAAPGMLICDPFVGSGSLLVACAHFGAYVMGTDIDYNLVMGIGKSSRSGQKWRAKEESIRNNLHQYGHGQLYLDVLVADASRHRLWRRGAEFLGAIVADPPYGIREPTMKLGSKKDDPVIIDDFHKEGHIPCKTNYSFSDILSDLLRFAARFLVVGGRLVFWIPVYREDYKESQVPRHPCFRLVANSEQILNMRVSRRLITLEKTLPYREGDEDVDQSSCLNPVEDHYKDASFRERYFRSAPGKVTKVAEQVSQSNETVGESSHSEGIVTDSF